MGLLALATVVVVALLVGFGVQYLAKPTLPYEWLIVSLALGFGAVFASESLPESTVFSGIKDWGPTLDGMVLIPAIIVGGLLALVADIGVRTGPMPRTT